MIGDSVKKSGFEESVVTLCLSVRLNIFLILSPREWMDVVAVSFHFLPLAVPTRLS